MNNVSRIPRGGFQKVMDRNEAKLILGFEPGEEVTQKEIKKKFRKMIIRNHPDQGGSKWLAMKINKAKDILDKGSK